MDMSAALKSGALIQDDTNLPLPMHTSDDVLITSLPKREEVVQVEIPEQKERKDNGTTDDSPFDDDEEKKDELTPGEKKCIDDNNIPLDIIKLDEEGDDTPTLPLNKKKQKGKEESVNKKKKKIPMYIFPITRLKLAWTRSSNILEFLFIAIGIIFSTLGWFCCVGGIPLMSVAELIVGCVYIEDCHIEPKIPVYLIVAGVFGTLQHLISIWTKYVPKDSLGPLKIYRAYCKTCDCVINLFLFIWFVLGCIWVYGVYSQVDYKDTYKDEYCAKGLYLFSFWILNLSFILISLLIVGAFCCIVFIVAIPKDEKVNYEV